MILSPAVALDDGTDPYVSDPVDIRGFGQLAFEIATGTMTGALKILVELSPDGDAFFPESVEDTSGTPSGGEVEVPISRVVRTFNASDSTVAFTLPCAGYGKVRIQAWAGTSGSAAIWVNKLRLAAN